MILYRADRRNNITKPELYGTDGLLTKQMNGGDPFFFKNYGWTKSIKSHIDFANSLEEQLNKVSAFLSFTDKEEIAKEVYLRTKKNLKYEPTTREFAEAYLFIANIPDKDLIDLGNGIFLYRFKCNYKRAKTDSNFITNLILAEFVRCNICTESPLYLHELLVIDVVTYLAYAVKSNSELKTAFLNAKRDNEWLLMPLDLMSDGKGFQSRIPISDFWRNELTVTSSYGAAPVDLEEAISLMKNGKINVMDMITHKLPLDDIQNAFKIASDAEDSLKVVLLPFGSA